MGIESHTFRSPPPGQKFILIAERKPWQDRLAIEKRVAPKLTYSEHSWFRLYLFCCSKKNISSKGLARNVSVVFSYILNFEYSILLQG
jgi:hypothetical protein